METPRRYTSHREMKRDRQKHHVSMTTTPPGYSKHDGTPRSGDHHFHQHRLLETMRDRPDHGTPASNYSLNPPSEQQPTSGGSDERYWGFVSATATRQRGRGLGLTFERPEQGEGLVLKGVTPGGEGERVDMQRYLGYRLHSVNGHVVDTNSKLAALCESSTSLLFTFYDTEKDAHNSTLHHTSGEALREDVHKHRADIYQPPDTESHAVSATDPNHRRSNRSLQRDIRHHAADVPTPQKGGQHREDHEAEGSRTPARGHYDPYGGSPRHTSYSKLRDDVRKHACDMGGSPRAAAAAAGGGGGRGVGDSPGYGEAFSEVSHQKRYTSYSELRDDMRKHHADMSASPSREATPRQQLRHHHQHHHQQQRGQTPESQQRVDPKDLHLQGFDEVRNYQEDRRGDGVPQQGWQPSEGGSKMRGGYEMSSPPRPPQSLSATPASYGLDGFDTGRSSHHVSHERLTRDIRLHRDTDMASPVPQSDPRRGEETPSHHTSYSRLQRDIMKHKADIIVGEDQPRGGSERSGSMGRSPPDHHQVTSYRKLSRDVRHHRSPMQSYSERESVGGGAPSTGRVVGDNEGIFYNKNGPCGSPQHDPSVLHRSQRRFEEEKNDHLTPIVSAATPSVSALKAQLDVLREGNREAFLPLEGRWICGDGTPCIVAADGMACYGLQGAQAPLDQREAITLTPGGGFELMGTRCVKVTPYRVEWSDGDVWTRSPAAGDSGPAVGLGGPQGGGGAPPSGDISATMRAVLRRGPHDTTLGLVWKGASTVVHAVQPGSAADRSGFGAYVNLNAVSVNGVHYPDARSFASAVTSGELRNDTELRFEFESPSTNVSM